MRSILGIAYIVCVAILVAAKWPDTKAHAVPKSVAINRSVKSEDGLIAIIHQESTAYRTCVNQTHPVTLRFVSSEVQ